MPQHIEVPGQGVVEFPDGMSDEAIAAAIHSNFGAPETPVTEPRSLVESAARQPGLLGRFAVEGATALPTMIANIPSASANLTRWAGDKMLGIEPSSPSVPYVNPYSEGLTTLGVPEPDTRGERLEGDAVKALSGTGTQLKLAKEALAGGTKIIGPKMASILSASPKVQAVSSVAGGLGGGAAREAGAGVTGQLIAAVLAGSAPSALSSTVPNLFKSAVRGGASSQTMQDNIAAFKAAGTTPSVGQATEARGPRALESILSKVPGSAGYMQRRAEQQAGEIGGGIEDIAQNLAGKTDPTVTGLAIQKGVTENFIPQARAIQKKLYNTLNTLMPPKKEVQAGNFTKIVDEMNAPVAGAENLSKTNLFVNKTISDVQSALKKDMGGTPAQPSTILNAQGMPLTTAAIPGKTTLPYQALKEMRSRIGEKLTDIDLSPDISRTELKRLYGALSQDMATAAQAEGPKAYAAFQRANNYTSTLHDRIDLLQGIIDKNGGPEKIFKAATSGTNEGATTLNAVMKALPADGKKMLTATVLRRMGRANAGNQNDAGDVFSTQKFLTNWAGLDNRAKTTLFGNQSKQFNADIEKIAKVASNIKQGSKVFANPSGTAPAENLLKTYGTIGVSLLSRDPLTMAATGTALATNNALARGMTNPKFVSWLAQNSNKPNTYFPTAINQLSQIAAKNNDPELQEISDDLKAHASPTSDDDSSKVIERKKGGSVKAYESKPMSDSSMKFLAMASKQKPDLESMMRRKA